MNILELCLSPDLGGLELYMSRTAKALSPHHKILAVITKDARLKQYLKDENIKYAELLGRSRFLPIKNAYKLASIIDNNDIDLIHMHWGKDLPLAAFAKILSKRKPALIYTRQMMITRAKNDFYHNTLYHQLDLMLTITRELEGLCKKFIPTYKDKVTTLYCGVNKPEIFLDENSLNKQRENLGFDKTDFIAGIIGRLKESKGQYLLIDAIYQAKENGHDIKALIVGHEMSPGYRDELKQQASNLGVQDNIVFQDFTSQPQQLMQLCDCVILASKQETFGLVLPEAMRSGIAVIGSNSGGVPEIIDHEKTGLLFETQNAASLCQQIQRLCLNPIFKETLARQGKQSADQRFDHDLHFQKLERHFQETIDKTHKTK